MQADASDLKLMLNCDLDLIKSKFLWYQRMDALMGTSPVVSHMAVSNSATALDLSVLDGDADLDDTANDENMKEAVSLHVMK